QVSRPVEQLAAFSRKLAQGEWDEPLTLHSVRELETLVEALDGMRRELKTYRDKLVITERQAAWSQMARKVAHEIKNPLTPIAISDTGPGLSAAQRAQLFVPGFTTKRLGSGLGLTIVERIVNDHHGTISVDPAAERGTTFRIRLPREL